MTENSQLPHDAKANGSGDTEGRILRRMQAVAAGFFIALIVLMVIADNVGRLFIDPTFHVSEVLFGTAVGALLALLGVGVSNLRLPGKKE